ncbi:hypothetical protein EDD11_007094 [Mortierella claussenii]|nr:hypothetical protein EDD11_007094 [Mortierella claussenii]
MPATGSSFLNFVIGFTVSLVASVMDAAGLNVLKLDHVRNSAKGQHRQRHECGRPMWHVGLYLYVGSQVIGSTIALNFLKAQWVAPLGSISLIFNFVFAKILVGTRIARTDVLGTIVVMLSVVWIVVFGGMKTGGTDIEDSLTIEQLKGLFSRIAFIAYFSVLNTVIIALLSLGLYAYWAITLDQESGQLRRNMKLKLIRLFETNRFSTTSSGLTLEGNDGVMTEEARDLKLRKFVSVVMATCGGLMASQTLLLTKSGIKLVTSTLSGHNQFRDTLSFFILFVLVLTAVLQVYCLNTALKLYDSVLVVPMFYGYYTAFGLINSVMYLNQLHSYPPWVVVLILIGIGCLILGVRMLSSPKPELGAGLNGSRDMVSTAVGPHDGIDGEEERRDGMGQIGTGHDEQEKETSVLRTGSKDLDQYGLESAAESANGLDMISKTSVMQNEELDKGDGIRVSIVKEGLASGAPVAANLAHVLSELERTPDRHETSRSSLPHTVLKAFGLHERRRSADRGCSSMISAEDKQTGATGLLRIDTSLFTVRSRSETRQNPASARVASPSSRPLSPSEFRAQYTNSPFPIKPKHLQDGAPGLGGSRLLPLVSLPEDDHEERGRSPKWATGGAKINHILEDLNPFKTLRKSSVDFASSGVAVPPPGSPSRAHLASDRHARRESWTGLPSSWDEPNRKMKHSMLFGEQGRSNAGRSSSSSTPVIYSRGMSTQEGVSSGIWATHASSAHSVGLSHPHHPSYSPNKDGEGSPWESQSNTNCYLTGVQPPLSATPGGGEGDASSSLLQIPASLYHSYHFTPSYSSGTHGYRRQLSFTAKNDQDLAASLAALDDGAGPGAEAGADGGSQGGRSSLSFVTRGTVENTGIDVIGGLFASSTGTFGDEAKTPIYAAESMFLSSIEQQLQQLQQHQHHPTSQLPHSMTTNSSISTLASFVPYMSTSTSLVQLATMDPKEVSAVGSQRGKVPSCASSTSLSIAPSLLKQTLELNLEEQDWEFQVEKSLAMVCGDDNVNDNVH